MPIPIDLRTDRNQEIIQFSEKLWELVRLSAEAVRIWDRVMNAWSALHADISMAVTDSGALKDETRRLLDEHHPVDENGERKALEECWAKSTRLYYGCLKDISVGLRELHVIPPPIQTFQQILEAIQVNGREGIYGETWVLSNMGSIVKGNEWPAVRTLGEIQTELEKLFPEKNKEYKVAEDRIKKSLESFGITAFPTLKTKADELLLQDRTPGRNGSIEGDSASLPRLLTLERSYSVATWIGQPLTGNYSGEFSTAGRTIPTKSGSSIPASTGSPSCAIPRTSHFSRFFKGSRRDTSGGPRGRK
ncbi:hypothetical protein QFC21_002525 [Naganishia friedmannii]|uniref:Uncharacterized protein n=1 Tax=Naganishia friedmannii TaxID=89922 RepID=A0ACC2VUL2_9TREE|nr:hypothetical protein QFC21_002525 [Naganishia friedmannii]